MAGTSASQRPFENFNSIVCAYSYLLGKIGITFNTAMIAESNADCLDLNFSMTVTGVLLSGPGNLIAKGSTVR